MNAPPRIPHNVFPVSPLQAAIHIHDKAVRIMDAKWGTDVVQTLVSPAMAAKFARACQKRDALIEAGDDEGAVDALDNVVRGLQKLDEAATEAGHVPLKVDRSWATRDETGNKFLFVQDEDTARAAHRSGRFDGYLIWSLPEVIRVLSDRSLLGVLDIKAAFPEATVTAVKPPVDWKRGDEVPF